MVPLLYACMLGERTFGDSLDRSKNSVLMPALHNLKFITSRVQKGLSDALSARIDSIPPGGLYMVSNSWSSRDGVLSNSGVLLFKFQTIYL